MSTVTSFEDYARDHDLSPDTFPYAEKGVNKLTKAQRSVWTAVFAAVAYFALNWLLAPQRTNALLEKIPSDSSWSDFLFTLVDPLIKGIDPVLTILRWLVIALAVWAVFRNLSYLVNVVRRQRAFERSVITNDKTARNIKQAIIKGANIDKRIDTVKRKIADETRKKDGDDGFFSSFGPSPKPSLDNEAELEALEAFKRMKVMVNTRQSVFGDDIVTRYMIWFDSPTDEVADEKLDKYTKNLTKSMPRYMRSNAKKADRSSRQTDNVGDRLQTSDKSAYYFTAEFGAVDKYAEPERKEVKKDTTARYETGFPLNLLTDNSQKIKENTEKANTWAKDNAPTIDTFLTTYGMNANRIDIQVGARNALFVYKLPTTTTNMNLDDMKQSLNANFGTQGVDCSIKNGNLNISIPTREEHAIPIDVASMYREVFF